MLALLAGCAGLPPGTAVVKALEVQAASQPSPPIPSDPIMDLLATQESQRWPFGSPQAYDPAKVEADRQRVVTYYAEHGFFQAEVETQIDRYQNQVGVRFVVTPGPRTRIVEVRLLGVEDLDGHSAVAIDALRGRLASGTPYTLDAYRALKDDLLTALLLRGRPYARVEGRTLVDKERAEAIIQYDVHIGPLVRLGGIEVEGEGPIPLSSVEREVLWNEGDPYSPDVLQRTEAALHRLGVFSLARLSLPAQEPSEAEVTLPVHVKVEVAKLDDLAAGGGVGFERRRQEVRARLEWRLRNFFGGMRTLQFSLKPGYAVIPSVWDILKHGPTLDAAIQLTQPHIFKSGVDAFATLAYMVGIQETYQQHGPSFRIGVERPFWERRLRPGIAYNLEFDKFFNIDPVAFLVETTPLGLGGFRPSYLLGYLEEYLSFDLRDRVLDPRSGMYTEVRGEQGAPAFGSNFSYWKLTWELRGYVPFGPRVVLASRLLFGILQPLHGEDSPVTRRLRLGGASSHRGFSTGRLSPEVPSQLRNGELVPIGSNAELLLSLDVRVRMFKLFGYWLTGTAFLDAGDAPAQFSDLDLGLLHYAVGPTLSYETPIGSISAGFGVRLNRVGLTTDGRPNPDPGQRVAFHLSIGAAF